MNGATTRSNTVLLDGANQTDFYGMNNASVGGKTLGAEGVKEYQVVTSLFGADYGMSHGQPDHHGEQVRVEPSPWFAV